METLVPFTELAITPAEAKEAEAKLH